MQSPCISYSGQARRTHLFQKHKANSKEANFWRKPKNMGLENEFCRAPDSLMEVWIQHVAQKLMCSWIPSPERSLNYYSTVCDGISPHFEVITLIVCFHMTLSHFSIWHLIKYCIVHHPLYSFLTLMCIYRLRLPCKLSECIL